MYFTFSKKPIRALVTAAKEDSKAESTFYPVPTPTSPLLIAAESGGDCHLVQSTASSSATPSQTLEDSVILNLDAIRAANTPPAQIAIANAGQDVAAQTRSTSEDAVEVVDQFSKQRAHFSLLKQREHQRRLIRLLTVFPFLKDVEAAEALDDCSDDEEKAILELTNSEYLDYLRNRIGLKYGGKRQGPKSVQASSGSNPNSRASAASNLTRAKPQAPARLTKKDTASLKQNKVKREERGGHFRLALDDALKQLEENQDESKMFEGWSAARIKAYKQVETCPNAYFYRFNAPGEKQRNGPWDEDEKQLFLDRLKEVGAGGQWGIFSMVIPGRVGYQCSSFYRVLLETGEVEDPNYQFDAKGKSKWARKRSDGTVQRRGKRKMPETHVDVAADETIVAKRMAEKAERRAKTLQRKTEDTEQSDFTPSSQELPNTGSEALTHSQDTLKARPLQTLQPLVKLTLATGRKNGPGSRRAAREAKALQATPADRRPRVESPPTPSTSRPQTCSRSSRNSSRPRTYPGLSGSSSSSQKRRRAPSSDEDDDILDVSHLLYTDFSTRSRSSKENVRKTTRYNESILSALNSENPLPGVMDPITMEEVVLPAISPYGHVLGWDTWMRALASGKVKGLCPVTKQKLTKSDLVVLTPENIEQYRHKIVNMD